MEKEVEYCRQARVENTFFRYKSIIAALVFEHERSGAEAEPEQRFRCPNWGGYRIVGGSRHET